MNRPQRGFTLVEVLVALSVSAVLISLVYGTVVLAQRSTQTAFTRGADTEVMHIGWQYLYDAIARAEPVNDPLDRDNRTGFEGTAERLAFVADQPAYLGQGGLTRIGVDIHRGDDVDALVVTRGRFEPNPDDREPEPPQQAVLVDDLASLEIRYFGTPEDGETAAWVDTWQEAPFLPALIEIRIKPRSRPAWPVLIARPMAGTGPIDIEPPPGDELETPGADETEPDESQTE